MTGVRPSLDQGGNMMKMMKLGFLGLVMAPFLTAAERPPVTIVMLGDSTTLSRDCAQGSKLTDFVQMRLDEWAVQNAQRVLVINAGKGGDTAVGALERLGEDVLSRKPDIVTISFGLNDTGKLTPEQFRTATAEIIRSIRRQSTASILLVTSTPFENAHHVWGKDFVSKGGLDEYMNGNICSQTRELAAEFRLPLCDLHERFIAEFKLHPGLISSILRADGVHLSEAGNRMASEYLAPAICSLIAERDRKAPSTPDAREAETPKGSESR
jgi:lysophospholipase L1-like esterase